MATAISTQKTIRIADYFHLGGFGFFLLHECDIEKNDIGKEHYHCMNCGLTFDKNLKNYRWLDEKVYQRVVPEGISLEYPSYSCTQELDVTIPCLESYPSYVKTPNNVHKRCKVQNRKHGRLYIPVTCLDCGKESLIAINQFSVLPQDYSMEHNTYCKKNNVLIR